MNTIESFEDLQTPPFTEQKLRQLLAPPILAFVATTTPDGWPHVVPNYFEYVDGELVMSVVARYQRIRNLRRDNRACVAFALKPRGTLIVWGRARLSDEAVEEVTRRLYARYNPPDLMGRLMESAMKRPRILVYVKPERVVRPTPNYYSKELGRTLTEIALSSPTSAH